MRTVRCSSRLPGGCLPGDGVSAQGVSTLGVCPVGGVGLGGVYQHALEQTTPPLQNDRQV